MSFIKLNIEKKNFLFKIHLINSNINNIISLGEKYKIALSDKDSVHVACDEEHVKNDFKIRGTKEIAIFPPVTGG